jgi:hypothetical protein
MAPGDRDPRALANSKLGQNRGTTKSPCGDSSAPPLRRGRQTPPPPHPHPPAPHDRIGLCAVVAATSVAATLAGLVQEAPWVKSHP